MSDEDQAGTTQPATTKTESTQEKSARLKALRLQEKEAVATRVARATRKAKTRRAILG